MLRYCPGGENQKVAAGPLVALAPPTPPAAPVATRSTAAVGARSAAGGRGSIFMIRPQENGTNPRVLSLQSR